MKVCERCTRIIRTSHLDRYILGHEFNVKSGWRCASGHTVVLCSFTLAALAEVRASAFINSISELYHK